MKLKPAHILLKLGAFQIKSENFTWASGIEAPFYCDNRILFSYPKFRKIILDELVEACSKVYPDAEAVVGVATAGITPGALLADRLSLPFAYFRSSAKAHGRKNQLEGQLESNQKIVVIEDLVSTGGSCLQAVQFLKEQGHEVLGVLSLFNYGLKQAKENFDNAQTKLHSLTGLEKILQISDLNETQKELVEKFKSEYLPSS